MCGLPSNLDAKASEAMCGRKYYVGDKRLICEMDKQVY
jgi:hypothetical protein